MLIGVKVWASSRYSLHSGKAWPTTVLSWNFVYLQGLYSVGQQQREVAKDKMQVGNASPIGTALG